MALRAGLGTVTENRAPRILQKIGLFSTKTLFFSKFQSNFRNWDQTPRLMMLDGAQWTVKNERRLSTEKKNLILFRI
jgi:hypothetical protein